MTDSQKLKQLAIMAGQSLDTGRIFQEARKRMIEDATNPVDIHEHVCRVAAEHAVRWVLTEDRTA